MEDGNRTLSDPNAGYQPLPGDPAMSETIAVDLRSVTISGSTALISIPGADRTIADGGAPDELCAQIEVTDEGDRWRVEAFIDKPDDLSNDLG